jgi:PAS domain S-box-containing protein
VAELDDHTTQILHQTLLGDAWDHADEAVVVFDEDRNYLAFNEAYCDLLGYRRDEIIAMGVGGSLAADRQSHETFDAIVQRGLNRIGRANVRRGDGTPVEVCYRIISTTVAGLPYFVGIVWRAEAA